jgi:hypothetical protein
VRFREHKAGELDRARREVRAWREANPHGTRDELAETVGPRFHKDYAVVLRGILFRLELDDARQAAGTAPGMEAVPEGALAGRTVTADAAGRVHGAPSGRDGDGGAVASAPPSPGRGDAR